MTDKEKEEAAQKRAEENLRRLKEFERHLKEAPKYQFNSNVFKKESSLPRAKLTRERLLRTKPL